MNQLGPGEKEGKDRGLRGVLRCCGGGVFLGLELGSPLIDRIAGLSRRYEASMRETGLSGAGGPEQGRRNTMALKLLFFDLDKHLKR